MLGRHARLVAPLLVALAVVVIASSCGSEADGSTDGVVAAGGRGGTRTDDEGGVAVAVTWDGQLSPLSFEIGLDTHSGDLADYDLLTLAILRNSRGEELKPAGVDAPASGHHAKSKVSFEATDAITEGTPYLELVLRDVAEVPERVFRWELNPPAAGS